MDKPNDAERRMALKGLAAAAITTTAAALGSGPAYADLRKPRRDTVDIWQGKALVYRLKTRGTKACRACKSHHRHLVFLSRHLADINRAHPGCNCPIVQQPIKETTFLTLFPEGTDGVAKIPRDFNL